MHAIVQQRSGQRREGPAAEYHDPSISPRIKISALWTAMLFVFAYVDLFSLYRADVRADIEAGRMAAFSIDQAFLVGVTAYILVPSLMVFLSLILPVRVARVANVALAVVYALTIVAGALGEWDYYVLASGIEVALLAGIVRYSWTWPKEAQLAETNPSRVEGAAMATAVLRTAE